MQDTQSLGSHGADGREASAEPTEGEAERHPRSGKAGGVSGGDRMGAEALADK
jgi:hypothetical protein